MPTLSKSLAPLAACAGLLALASATATPAYAAGPLPDLTVTRSGPSTVYARAQFTETLKVTNRGTAPAAGVVVNYAPVLAVTPATKGVACTPIMKGHSGRGGGYTQVGWACKPTLKQALAPGKSTSFNLTVTAPAVGSFTETQGAEPSPYEEQLNLVSHASAATVTVTQPPIPAAPSGVSVAKVGDRLSVSWIPAPATAAATTSSTVTLTPVGSSTAPTVTGWTGGTGTSAVTGPVEPSTTYEVSVVSADAAGSSPASSPVTYTTPPSTVPPSAPVSVRGWWLYEGAFIAAWAEGNPGDSQIDEYQITAKPEEAEEASPQTHIEPASATESEFLVHSENGWSFVVRAHNAAGWGAWSAPFVLGGL